MRKRARKAFASRLQNPSLTVSRSTLHCRGLRFAYRNPLVRSLQAFEIADRKIVSRCRYAQYRGEKIALSQEGMLVTGLVHSLRQHEAGRHWIITLVISKRSLAA
jgi:hypothetical protein